MGRGEGKQETVISDFSFSMYHISGDNNREIIGASGLEARSGPLTKALGQPKGVYLFQSLRIAEQEAEKWAKGITESDPEKAVDIWQVSLSGISIEPDPKIKQSWYSKASIPPGNIRLCKSL
jgi:hypothetical protein